MINDMRLFLASALVLSLAACATATNSVNSGAEWLRSQPSIRPSSGIEVSAETAVVAGALSFMPAVTIFKQSVFSSGEGALLYIIYDPLAPNWSIEEKLLSDETYYLSMRAKSFRTGGDGESMQILKRRARQLQYEKGYAGYRILEYTEGIESSTPLTHRVSEGTIQLVRTQTPGQR